MATMTQADFNTWLDSHCAAFPAMDGWLDKLNGKTATLRWWYRRLAPYTLDECDRATAEMFRAVEHPVFSEHVHEVARLVERERHRLSVGKLQHAESRERAAVRETATWEPPAIVRSAAGLWCYAETGMPVDVWRYGHATENPAHKLYDQPLVRITDAGRWEVMYFGDYVDVLSPPKKAKLAGEMIRGVFEAVHCPHEGPQPRYRCPKCLDRGYGHVLRRVKYKAHVRDIAAVAACDCSAGDKDRGWMHTATNVTPRPDDAQWPERAEWNPAEHEAEYAG